MMKLRKRSVPFLGTLWLFGVCVVFVAFEAGGATFVSPMMWAVAQQVAVPEAAEMLPPQFDDERPGEDIGNVAMDLPSRGPLRQTTARPGNWLDVTDDGEISEVLRRHWVSLDAQNRLKGRISTLQNGRLQPARQLRISFLQRGATIATATTDDQGQFEVTGLNQGAYCLVAGGPNGFLAYSVNVAGANDRQARVSAVADPVQLTQLGGILGELEIDSVAVPPTFRTVRNLIRRYNFLDSDESRLVPAAEEVAENELEAPQQQPAPAKEQSGLEEQTNTPGPAATTIGNHVVYLTPDGRLVGKLTSIDFESGRPKSVEQVTVHIIRNDRLVDSAGVKRNGVFELRGLRPGSYSLVAAGRDGFGAIGFQLRERDPQVSRHQLDDHTQPAIDGGEGSTHLVKRGPDILAPFPFTMAMLDDPRNLRTALRNLGAGRGEGRADAGADGFGRLGEGAFGLGVPVSSSGGSGGSFAGGATVGNGLGPALLGAGGLAGIAGLANGNNGGGGQPEDDVMSPFQIENPTLPPLVGGPDPMGPQ